MTRSKIHLQWKKNKLKHLKPQIKTKNALIIKSEDLFLPYKFTLDASDTRASSVHSHTS